MSRKSLLSLLSLLATTGACAAFAIGQELPATPGRDAPVRTVLSLDDTPESPAAEVILQPKPTQEPDLVATGSKSPADSPGLTAEVRVLPATGGAPPQTAAKNMRVDSDLPNMRVVTRGPDTLIVGKSATFVLELQNQGGNAAGGVVVRCSIPSWVELKKHKASAGKIAANKSADNIEWTLSEVAANGKHQLKLDLIPRAGRAFDLDVQLSVQPRGARHQITIQEPKLKVSLQGPKSFVFEEDGSYKVTIKNPGTAAANNVALKINLDGKQLAVRKIGTVPAQGSQIVELDLQAQRVGTFKLDAVATAEYDLADSAQSTVQVRCGKPVVQIAGPTFEFAGTNSKYSVTVSNNGDAPLRYVTVNMALPNGATYVSGLNAPQLGPSTLGWSINDIAPGGSKSFPVVVRLTERGAHKFDVKASAGETLVANASTATTAETSADLKLEVFEPRGPQAIGEIVEYEIRISNIGSDAAKNISVIAVCPPELKAVAVTGDAAIKSGQIFFRPIKQIDRGKEVVQTVKVRATSAGNHSFRVVVKCHDPELRFASEDTTRYFDRNARMSKALVATKVPRSPIAQRVIRKSVANPIVSPTTPRGSRATPIFKVAEQLPKIVPN